MILSNTETEKKLDPCEAMPEIFNALSNEQLRILTTNRFEVRFKAGETIFKQGSALTHIIYLKEGKAKILLEDSNGQTILLKILKQPDMIGGPGFHTDYRHHFSVVAMEDTTACMIDVNLFKNFILSNPQFGLDMIAFLNHGFINLYDKLRGLTNKHMSGRIADTLIYLADEVYNNAEFTTPLSRIDIANMSAMTKESAIRTLKAFKEGGIIDCKGDYIKILKKDTLINISKKG